MNITGALLIILYIVINMVLIIPFAEKRPTRLSRLVFFPVIIMVAFFTFIDDKVAPLISKLLFKE